MKEEIEALIKIHGSVSKVAKHYKIPRQTLINWAMNDSRIKRALDFRDKARMDLRKK